VQRCYQALPKEEDDPMTAAADEAITPFRMLSVEEVKALIRSVPDSVMDPSAKERIVRCFATQRVDGKALVVIGEGYTGNLMSGGEDDKLLLSDLLPLRDFIWRERNQRAERQLLRDFGAFLLASEGNFRRTDYNVDKLRLRLFDSEFSAELRTVESEGVARLSDDSLTRLAKSAATNVRTKTAKNLQRAFSLNVLEKIVHQERSAEGPIVYRCLRGNGAVRALKVVAWTQRNEIEREVNVSQIVHDKFVLPTLIKIEEKIHRDELDAYALVMPLYPIDVKTVID
jgi:hypothetical protein